MRYVMKQRVWSWSDSFTITDENEMPFATVEGKALSFGDKLQFLDQDGTQLAAIKETVLAWGPTYEIHRDGALAATVKKNLTFLRNKFTIETLGEELVATGDFADREYAVERNGETVATISKAWFSWSDTYGVDVTDGEDAILLLAVTVAIDCMLEPA
jgi:uncharacterized protein YxjI